MDEIIPSHALMPLSQSDDDLAQHLREFVQDKEAFAPNTWRQLMSVMRVCHRWASANNRRLLPMSPEDLRDYLSYLHSLGRASSTIGTHQSLIAMLHRNAGLIPPSTSPLVSRAVRKINRVAVVAGERTGQAVPFRLSDLQRVEADWAQQPSLRNLRDLAFLHVAYSTLMRISEVARFRVGDVMRAEDGRIILEGSWTKTILDTGSLVKALGSRSSEILTQWLVASGLINEPDAFLFSPVHRSGKVKVTTDQPMSTPALKSIFTRAWEAAGPGSPAKPNKNRYRRWSGHSARVGAAQDLARKGYSVPQIMQEGTWKKPETLMRYIRYVEAHKGAMVDFMENNEE
ncbi:tyrosine-type recombinase/integrase [Pantoea sp. KPR_PJ]|uniref:tyrosine-type recombinase/integrase n=1 Tax=Pantoea sp. KPR_PJ TaxID=2738375 RepID=UPI003527BD65